MKTKFPAAAAKAVAAELTHYLLPVTERLICAGSLRRRKAEVGDVEFLFIPKFGHISDGTLFGDEGSLVDEQLQTLQDMGILAKRTTVNGTTTYGPKNKLMVHCSSGIPVDLFTATAENWWNYIVCRTGPSENNIRIADAAKRLGCKWHPYGPGFTDEHGRIIPMDSEAAVFEFVGLPYLEPWHRD
jgi:DNA polymerase/3'-5' exonuclease PolX